MPATPRASSRRRSAKFGRQALGFGPWDWLFVAALVAAVFLVYKPAWNGGFLFDDDLHLLNNPVLRPGGLAKIWVPGGYLNYWPLTYTTYWAEYQLWGLALPPRGFHWVNLAGHAISALLLWRILLQLRARRAVRRGVVRAASSECRKRGLDCPVERHLVAAVRAGVGVLFSFIGKT